MSRSTASVIICTRNRPQTVCDAVEKVASQRQRTAEVIVVDQSDEANEELAARPDVTYLRDPQRGAPRAKNLGISTASGEILLFLDDDTVAPPGLVEAHLANYADESVHAVAGRVLCPDDPPLDPRAPIGRLCLRDLSMTANFHATRRAEVDHVYGCNWSVRREVLERVGGFDESLQPEGKGTAFFEEAELSLRIRRAGSRIVFDPLAVAEHRKAPTGGCRPRDQREWSYWFYRNKTILFRLYCRRRWLAWFLARQAVSVARRAASAEVRRGGSSVGFAGCCVRALWDGWRAAPRAQIPVVGEAVSLEPPHIDDAKPKAMVSSLPCES